MDYNIEKLAEILHTLGCQKPHGERAEELFDPQEGVCYWYCENMLPPEEQAFHNHWRMKAEELCTMYSISSTNMLRFLFEYLELRRKLEELKKRYPAKAVEDLAPLLLFDSSL